MKRTCGAKVQASQGYDRAGHARRKSARCGKPAIVVDHNYALPLCAEHAYLNSEEPRP